jgi:hypothetical protein
MRRWLVASCSLVLSCATPESVGLEFHEVISPDAPLGTETITCFGVDATQYAGHVLCDMEWSIGGGAVPLHHAILYADASRDFLGVVPCDLPPPNSISLGGWLPGSASNVLLPSDVGMIVPATTQSLVIQAHAIRVASGDVTPTSVAAHFCDPPPDHVAASIAVVADVPVIAPHSSASSTATCVASHPMHVVRFWPHMHRAGTEIRASRTGASAPLIDITPWDFNHQIGYLTGDVLLAPGDALTLRCDWTNTSDAPITQGQLTSNEMCTMGVLVWPATAAQWMSCQ